MNYGFIAIPDAEVPLALEPVFQHVVTTYASEANKTVSVEDSPVNGTSSTVFRPMSDS